MTPRACQRWRERQARYRPAGEVINPSRFSVEVIDRTTGAAFTKRHHYSGSHVASRLDVALLWRPPFGAEVLAGVCAFSTPMTGAVISRWCGTAPEAGLELGRLVLLDEVPGNGESWFVSRALRLLHERIPEVSSVVSFSDPLPRLGSQGLVMPGHIGTVYQALGARYAGRTRRRYLWLDREGRILSERSLSKLRLGERGADAMERHLAALGAPRRRAGEEGGAYVGRALAAGLAGGWLSRVAHPGNHAYLFPVLPEAGRSRAEVRARGRARREAESRWPLPLPYPRCPDALPGQQPLF